MGVVGAAASEEGLLARLGRYRKLALRRRLWNSDLMLQIRGARALQVERTRAGALRWGQKLLVW